MRKLIIYMYGKDKGAERFTSIGFSDYGLGVLAVELIRNFVPRHTGWDWLLALGVGLMCYMGRAWIGLAAPMSSETKPKSSENQFPDISRNTSRKGSAPRPSSGLESGHRPPGGGGALPYPSRRR